MATANVKGLADLQKLLDSLPAKIEANIIRGGLRAGMNTVKPEVVQQLESNGSVESGELVKGLKLSTRSRRGIVTVTLRVTGKHAFAAKWLEFTGAAPHVIKAKNGGVLAFGGVVVREVLHPGFSAKPFLRPSLDSQAGAATVAVGEYIKKRLATKHGLDTAAIEIEEL